MDDYQMITANDVSSLLLSFITMLTKAFKYVLQSVKKYFIVTILAFAGIVALSFYHPTPAPSYYESTMACQFHTLNAKDYGEMVRNIDILAANGSYNALATALGITPAEAKNIVGIQGINANGNPLYKELTEMGPIYIKVKSTNRSVFPVIQAAMLNYLNNNSPFHNKVKLTYTERLTKKTEFIDKDLQSIDSIISAYSFSLRNGHIPKDTASSIQNIIALFNYKDQLEDKKLDKEARIAELVQPVELMYGFYPPENPVTTGESRSLVATIIRALFISLVITVLFSLFAGIKTN